jgi:putative ABC transport system permease protein
LRLLRNIFRRKLRAFLTIFGIAIGVFALVVMGAIAEKLTLLVDGGVKYYAGKVIVRGDGGVMGMGGAPLKTSLAREIEKVDGVARASANVSGLMETQGSAVNMGTTPTYMADDGRDQGLETFQVTLAQGRDIKNSDRAKVVLGSDSVAALKGALGGYVTIRDKRYQVVGILNKTLTAPDNTVIMSMKDAQAIATSDLPDSLEQSVNPDTLVTSYAVYLKPGADPEVMARRIKRHVSGISVLSPNDFEKQIKQPLAVFTSIIYAIGAISLLVGGLSVINTMTMSVAERTREIGVRKAIGASDGQIMGQFILESGVIGLMGGVIGLLLGMMIANAGNAMGAASGNVLFLVTNRLMVGSVAFAVILGVVSGLYPAWHAANLNPVEALRYE